MSNTTPLDQMKRSDLEVHAKAVGIDDPKAFRTADELRAAVLEAGEPGSGGTLAGVNSPHQDSGVVQTQTVQHASAVNAQPKQRIGVYMVDGVEVDPNGTPVAG